MWEGLLGIQFLGEGHGEVPQLQICSIQTFITMKGSSQGTNGVSEYLRELADKRPLTNDISLEFNSISDLLPYLNLLDRFTKLKKLSLHGNRIRELPTDLSVLQNVEQLSLTNNLLDDNVEMTIISLKTMPKLKILHYQVSKDKEQRIVEEVKTLEYLNNTKVLREKAKQEFQFHNATHKSLADFAESLVERFITLTYYQKKYLGEMIEEDAEERFRQELTQISRECLGKLSLNKDKATESLESIMLYITKFDMFELLKIRAVNICMDIYSDLGKTLKNILDDQDRIFKNTAQLTLSLARMQLDQKEKEDMERYNNQFQAQHSIVNKNAVMQKELKRMRKQKDDLIGQVSQIEAHSKKLTDFLVRTSRGETQTPINIPVLQTFQSGAQKSKEHVPNVVGVGQKKGSPMRLVPDKSVHIGKDHSNTFYNSTSKSLTIKQLKDVIEEIQESKLKFDEKNYQGRLARETMNQYLFTYLNQKYGLKSLTLEAANNIVTGIQDYSSKDNQVAVFGKILRNQVDQQFRFVQAQLRTTILDLLKMHIKAKLPYKNISQINEAMNKRVHGEISYEECEDLVRYLYNKPDADQIMLRLQGYFVEVQTKIQSNRRRHQDTSTNINKGKIEFSLFLQQVLNFQLKNHQKLLRPLVATFKKRDRDSDGIIGEQEFIAIISDLCEDAEELIPALLDIIDPYETKVITFTQMVRLVANYPEENPILNRYAQKNNEEGHNLQA